MHFRRVYVCSALLVIIAFLTACDQPTSSVTSLPPNKGAIPTVTLDNTSPANIDFSLSVNIEQDDASKPANMIIGPQFMHDNSVITFTRGEKLTCGGVAMPTTTGSGYSPANTPSAGTVVNCTYLSPQGQASFSYTVPEQPKVMSPTAGATVARSVQTAVSVTIVPTCKTAVGIMLGDSSGHGASVPGTPGGCSSQQTVDTTPLQAGAGKLGVTEGGETTEITNNPGFHSFKLAYWSSSVISVTWK
jgi:hypothetical protein